jgi:hypothetical protein
MERVDTNQYQNFSIYMVELVVAQLMELQQVLVWLHLSVDSVSGVVVVVVTEVH